MNVVCSIFVWMCTAGIWPCLSMESRVDVSGVIIAEGQSKYAVNFANAAKEKGYIGEYSQKLVDKNDCVIMK